MMWEFLDLMFVIGVLKGDPFNCKRYRARASAVGWTESTSLICGAWGGAGGVRKP